MTVVMMVTPLCSQSPGQGLACAQRRFVEGRVKDKGRRQPEVGRLHVGRVKGEVLIEL